MNRLLHAIDQLSKTVGHAFAWCILILTFGTCYEVFMRWVLNDPTNGALRAGSKACGRQVLARACERICV